MKMNKYKRLKAMFLKGLEGFLLKKEGEKSTGDKLNYFKSFITIFTVIIMPILNNLQSETVIFNNVTYQNVQTINVNYDLKN